MLADKPRKLLAILAVLALCAVGTAIVLSVKRGYHKQILPNPIDNIETWCRNRITINNLDESDEPQDALANGTWYNATITLMPNRYAQISGCQKGESKDMDHPITYTFKRERKFKYSEHKNLSRYPKEDRGDENLQGTSYHLKTCAEPWPEFHWQALLPCSPGHTVPH